jgi:hypothetical protein
VATIVPANDGDTLCSLAIDAGFVNCQPLRDEPQNQGKDFLNRSTLKSGDVVVIPDKKVKDESKGADTKHEFVKKTAPKVSIRFVHGSPDKKYLLDDQTTFLEISNYETNLAGTNGRKNLPNGFGFDPDGHADPDTFKVEVVDPAAGGSVDVLLQAMKPVYKADGTIDHHEEFSGAQAAARKVNVTCQKVSSGVAFRSKYLRLVTDEIDQATVSDQTLFVSDIADGLGTGKTTDNDFVEILDQQVRASYSVNRCPGPQKCTVSAQVPVGQNPFRIKLVFHAFRSAPGAAGGVNGVTAQMLRRRAFRWFRRAYAQASMSPKLVGPVVEFVDPPSDNMLVISQDHGLAASGFNSGISQSTLSFTLSTPPPHLAGAPADPVVIIQLTPSLTPSQIGNLIVGALPAGFNGTAFANARAFNAIDGSSDVLIVRADGKRVMILNETTDDTSATVTVARVNIVNVNDADSGPTLIPTTAEFRRVIRAAPGAPDQLDCYVVGQFANNNLRGRAFVPARDLGAAFQPPDPLKFAAIMAVTSSSGPVLDSGDNLPFTFPHEAGHVLNDAFHTDSSDGNGPTQLMSGTGTSVTNAVDATKRICDGPVLVQYGAFDPAQTTPGASKFLRINAVQRFRNGAATVSEAW